MKKYVKRILLVAMPFLLMGCTMFPESVEIHPAPYTQNVPNIGHGKTITLSVVDGRTDKDIGRRPSGFGPMAPISLANNPAQAIYKAVYEGLTARGFKPVTNAPTKLTITLNQLKYQQKSSFMIFGVLVHTSLAADAKNDGLSYGKTYRADDIKHYPIVPMTVQDETQINQVLSDNINRMFLDKNLMAFLAK